jgi:hypothetical protein
MMGQNVSLCVSIMAKAQVRLEKDVAVLVKKSAKQNSRSVPKEVNHLLREVLKSKSIQP